LRPEDRDIIMEILLIYCSNKSSNCERKSISITEFSTMETEERSISSLITYNSDYGEHIRGRSYFNLHYCKESLLPKLMHGIIIIAINF
jgi:hypothetical protein